MDLLKSPSSVDIKVPAKTFLMGEYLALVGGPSLVVATQPFFRAQLIAGAHRNNDRLVSSFPEGSPAWRYLRVREENWHLHSWSDPHGGRGGFGGSTAEYLAVRYADVEGALHSRMKATELQSEVSVYQMSCDSRIKPSGADLVGQICGQCTWWSRNDLTSEPWPFAHCFFLLRTGFKVNTHQHLEQIAENSEKKFADLERISNAALQAWSKKSGEDFFAGLDLYGKKLDEFGWLTSQSKELVQELRTIQGVVAAKGCGAMGADVILVAAEKKHKERLRAELAFRQLEVVATETEISPGIQGDFR